MSELFFRSIDQDICTQCALSWGTKGCQRVVGDCSVTVRRRWRPSYQTGKTVQFVCTQNTAVLCLLPWDVGLVKQAQLGKKLELALMNESAYNVLYINIALDYRVVGGGRVVRWCWVNFQCRGVL